jgi:hypothetical protein
MPVSQWKPGTGTSVVQPVRVRPLIEMQQFPGIWIDITPRWRADTPIVLTYGIQGSDPTDRVASAGTLEWQMDNGTRPGGTLGEASVFSATRFDPQWRLGVPIRFSIGETVGTRQIKFEGTLASAMPSPDGKHGERRVFCTALDRWDDYADMAMPDQVAIADQSSGQLITRLMNSLPAAQQPPPARTIETGAGIFEWAFDGGTGQTISVRDRINDIALSEPGYAYNKGGPTGTQFIYETLTTRVGKPVLFSITDTDITEVVAVGSRDDLYGSIRIRFYPAVLDPDPTAVIYSLDAPNTLVAGNSVLNSISGPYRGDVDNMIGAVFQIQPSPVTGLNPNGDYQMNSAPDGTGTDLTPNFIVIATFTGVGVKFLIQNTGATPGYITRLQVRGQILTRQESMVEKTVAGSQGVKTLDFTMPYQGNANRADATLNFFASIYGQPYAQIQAIRFCATRSPQMFAGALLREPGDKITVTETTTGMVSAPFIINSAQYVIEAYGAAMFCTWGLEQSSASGGFWTLDTSALGTSTVLGY